MVLLLVLSVACRVIFVMEQPRSSDHIIANHHRFAWFCNHVCYVSWWRCEFISVCLANRDFKHNSGFCPAKVIKTYFWMAHFGGASPKPQVVWSNHSNMIRDLVGGLLLHVMFIGCIYVCFNTYNNNSTWAEDRGKLTAEDKNGCTLETTRSFV